MSATLEFLNAFSAAGLMAVLHTPWRGLAVAAFVWFVVLVMARGQPAIRHPVSWAMRGLLRLLPLTLLLPRGAVPPCGTPKLGGPGAFMEPNNCVDLCPGNTSTGLTFAPIPSWRGLLRRNSAGCFFAGGRMAPLPLFNPAWGVDRVPPSLSSTPEQWA